MTPSWSVWLCIPLFTGMDAPLAAEPPPDSLRGAFDAYVSAVQGADIDALFEVVTEGEDFFFITASGARIDGVQGYRRFHEEWFNETGWSMPVNGVRVQQDGDRGRTLAVFHYRQALDDGTTYNLISHFTLLWRRETGAWRVYGDICSPIQRYYTAPSGQRLYSEPQREVIRTLLERRTVRRFTDRPVPEEHLRILLDAARHAPTAGNQQPWRFLIVGIEAVSIRSAQWRRTPTWSATPSGRKPGILRRPDAASSGSWTGRSRHPSTSPSWQTGRRLTPSTPSRMPPWPPATS